MKVSFSVARLAVIVSAALLVFSCSKADPDQPETPPQPQPLPQNPQVVYTAPENTSFLRGAYFPYYQDIFQTAIPDEFLSSTIDVAYYAFATIKSDYTLQLNEPLKALSLVTRCHDLGIKVLLSFAGSSSIYKEMVSDVNKRAVFINSLKQLLNIYYFDGVDNDWEYPNANDASAEGNRRLMVELSNWLHDPKVGKYLTAAINCGKYDGGYRKGILDEVFPLVDWFNVMTYDDFSTSVPGKHHSNLDLVKDAYAYWITTRKMPKNKFMCGLPAYGRASGITQTGTTLTYRNIINQGGDPDEDSAVVTSSSYAGGEFTIYYNGRKMVKSKIDYIKEKSLSGYFFWEATQDLTDDRSLLRAASAAAQ